MALILSLRNFFVGGWEAVYCSESCFLQQLPIVNRDFDYLRSAEADDLETIERARLLAPCLFNQTAICRYDHVGQFLEESPPIPNVVHRPVQAVPSYRRIPLEMANNRTFIVRGTSSYPDDLTNMDATNSTLNDYNPFILPLFRTVSNGSVVSDLDQKLLDELTGRYHSGFTHSEANQVKYLAVFRSSNHYPRCIPGGFQKGKDKGYQWVNYPSIALLDENLQPIDEASILIDIERYYFQERDTRLFQDFSLYAARTTKDNTKKDHLFLVTNGMLIIPMALRRIPPGKDHGDNDWITKIQQPKLSKDIVHGTGIQVRMTSSSIQGPMKSFVAGNKAIRLAVGKNMHLFESSTGSNYVELWPYSNHSSQQVNFFWDNFTTFQSYSWDLKEVTVAPDTNSTPSFQSNYGSLPEKEPTNRGTGCCADMTLSDGRVIKLGIAHTVVRPLNYLHRFYAFVPDKPFQILRISGLFCLGSMQRNDSGFDDHWLSHQNEYFQPMQTRYGDLLDFDCPPITFASGVTNMVDHSDNYIIISYGVEDCYSRSIFVHKRKIEMLLFPDLMKRGHGTRT